MELDQVVLRMVRARLSRPFENRWQRFVTWTKVLVRVDGDGEVGYGECTAMETPYYNYETVETAWHILERYLAPAALASPHGTPDWALVNGHEEAKGALECALWDLRARLAGRPLCKQIGGASRPVTAAATIGIEPTVDDLVERAAAAHEAGYGRIRVKIRPGWDVEPLRALRDRAPQVPVIADGNGAYGVDDLVHLRDLDGLGLLALEQPFPARALDLSARLQAEIGTPVCLDESVKDRADLERALAAGAARMVNVKIGRVGGLSEAVRVHDLCRAHGVACFVGAKYELGIGRWTNLALATLPGMTLPSDVGPADRYYVDDGVDRSVRFVAPGQVEPLPLPGVGAAPTDALEVLRTVTVSRPRRTARAAATVRSGR
jgi:O-succinylbenzoate synthase